jgi:hypothetical protein
MRPSRTILFRQRRPMNSSGRMMPGWLPQRGARFFVASLAPQV